MLVHKHEFGVVGQCGSCATSEHGTWEVISTVLLLFFVWSSTVGCTVNTENGTVVNEQP